MTSNSFSTPAWWKEAIIYQVYPASFNACTSSSQKGWGTLKGITAKLDYVQSLGATVVWSSPFCRSPQADMGYDISDYCDVDPIYGTLADADELIAELGKRGMKLMVDLVVNHTSNEHEWFLDSKNSKGSKKRDWYIWRPGKVCEDGKRRPPNNWSMILGEQNSAWTWDEGSQEYYLSLFTPQQPDLNWENPEVRRAVHDVLRFWLDRGACGFRMDVINLISKVPGLPDGDVVDPDHEYQPGFKSFANGPRLHEYLQEINREVLTPYDAITVGEMPFVRDEEEILRIVHPERMELNMIFQFEIVDIDNVPGSYRMTLHPWQKSEIRRIMALQQRMMQSRGGWNSIFIENHDNPRSVSRYVDDSDEYREVGAKLLALMMTTLSGTLFVYQGQELGLRNFARDSDPEEYIEDVESVNYWKKMQSMYPGDQTKLDLAKRCINAKARDHARYPMPWTAEAPNAGFSAGDVEPWMKVHPDFGTVNAEAEVENPGTDDISVFHFWKRGLANRKEHKQSFVYGAFELLGEQDVEDPIFAYTKTAADGSEKWTVVLNFSGEERNWPVPEGLQVERWVAGNYVKGEADKSTSGHVLLRPWEGLLGMCQG